ncbi:MAG: hypothetical protein HYV07_32445 [Deltaproteobacteria bacterium]|nr:hypothetical protein [Deltaproteobacteria bacterium]
MFRAPGGADRRALEATLELSRSLTFYENRWSEEQARVRTFAKLPSLPFLEKLDAAAHQEDLRVPGSRLQIGVVSSATTREGRPLRVLQGDVVPRPEANGPVRTLRVQSPRHGLSRSANAGELVFYATLHENTIDVLRDLLEEHRPRALVAPVSTLKWVTVALEERGLVPQQFGLSVVGTTGYLLTRAARRWLEIAWGAPFLDNWSMSELDGFAHPCKACGHAHWVGAPTWFELIDATTQRPTRHDFGELVATTLLPHGASMPLVRYRTGDLIMRGPLCRGRGRRGMRFLGRSQMSAIRQGRPLALSGELQEVGESLPDIAQVLHPAERLGLVPVSDIGVPKLRARQGGSGWIVDAELRFDPGRFPARANVVRELIAARVHRDVRIILHRPGTLDLSRLARKL